MCAIGGWSGLHMCSQAASTFARSLCVFILILFNYELYVYCTCLPKHAPKNNTNWCTHCTIKQSGLPFFICAILNCMFLWCCLCYCVGHCLIHARTPYSRITSCYFHFTDNSGFGLCSLQQFCVPQVTWPLLPWGK